MIHNKIGNRMTKQRKMILDVLLKSSSPQTAGEIYGKLQKVNLTSVYRTLDLLSGLEMVQTYEFGDGIKRYEILKVDDHHHHLICDNCGKIEDIELKEKALIDRVKKHSNFLIKSHNLEFFGLCLNCQ